MTLKRGFHRAFQNDTNIKNVNFDVSKLTTMRPPHKDQIRYIKRNSSWSGAQDPLTRVSVHLYQVKHVDNYHIRLLKMVDFLYETVVSTITFQMLANHFVISRLFCAFGQVCLSSNDWLSYRTCLTFNKIMIYETILCNHLVYNEATAVLFNLLYT